MPRPRQPRHEIAEGLKPFEPLPPSVWKQRTQAQKDAQKHLNYKTIFIWRGDVRRLRKIEAEWHMSRCKAVNALIALADDPARRRYIDANPEAWARLEDAADLLRVSKDVLLTRLIELASECTTAQLRAMLGPLPRK